MSSGVYRSTFATYLAHSCGWQGVTDFDYDPEVDRVTAVAMCPGCDEETAIHMPYGGWF